MKRAENNIYPCTWKRVKTGYQLSLTMKGCRGLTVTAEAWEKAVEDLCELVCEKLGDGEAVFEFDPPSPTAQGTESYFEPAYFRLGANDRVKCAGLEEGLYGEGYCDCCKGGLGARTRKPRSLPAAPKLDFGFVSGTGTPKLFSRLAVEFFLRLGLPAHYFLEVVLPARSKTSFFELVAEPEIKKVGVKNPSHLGGWECVKCGLKYFLIGNDKIARGVNNFLPRSEVMRSTRGVFVVGNQVWREIVLAADALRQLKQSPGIRGLLSDKVALLPDSEIDWSPKVDVLTEFSKS